VLALPLEEQRGEDAGFDDAGGGERLPGVVGGGDAGGQVGDADGEPAGVVAQEGGQGGGERCVRDACLPSLRTSSNRWVSVTDGVVVM
jgi:hypothetical protein